MHAFVRTLLLYNTIILFWNCTIYTAASSEVPAPLQLAQFSPSSGWPESETSRERSEASSRRLGRAALTKPKVPLPSRRPVIDAGTKHDTAPPPALLVEKPRLRAQDREPQHIATPTGQGIEAGAVGDDPAWLRCSGSSGSTESAGHLRIQACTEILARSPAEPAERRRVALTLRAFAYDSLNSDRTLRDYAALLELNPDDMQVLFLRSAYHARQQKYDLAVADLDRIVAAQPANARAFAERGRVYELKKDLNSAEKDYRKAADIDPGNPEYTSNLQNIAKLRSAESEKNELKKSVVFGFDDASYKLCANFSESPDKRIEACSIVIARLPGLEIESAFFSAEKTENLSESVGRISTATGYDTTWMNISAAIGLRGLAYAEKKDLESALVDINNAIDKAGRMIFRNGTASTLDRMMLRRGDIFMEIGEYQRAEDDYRTVSRVNLVAEAHTRLAALHFTRGRHDQAQEEIRIALKRDPKDGLAYSLRGRIGLAQGDYRKALEDCQQAVDIQPKNSPNARACVETARNALNGNAQSAPPGKNPAKAE
jgi:tetratricopeptide (TPR) repeat protein